MKLNWIRASILVFLLLKISIAAIAFYWRNNTHNICHLAVFIPKSVRP